MSAAAKMSAELRELEPRNDYERVRFLSGYVGSYLNQYHFQVAMRQRDYGIWREKVLRGTNPWGRFERNWQKVQRFATEKDAARRQRELEYDLGLCTVAQCGDALLTAMLNTKIRRLFDRDLTQFRLEASKRVAARYQQQNDEPKKRKARRVRDEQLGVVYRYGRKPKAH
jgi:hypothetical protein